MIKGQPTLEVPVVLLCLSLGVIRKIIAQRHNRVLPLEKRRPGLWRSRDGRSRNGSALRAAQLVFHIQTFREPGDAEGDQGKRFCAEDKKSLGFGKPPEDVIQADGQYGVQLLLEADQIRELQWGP